MENHCFDVEVFGKDQCLFVFLKKPFPKGTTRTSALSEVDLRIITPNLKCAQSEQTKTERKPSLAAVRCSTNDDMIGPDSEAFNH